VRGDTEDRFLFAKLYSTTHLRSDRWYKLGRTILYGALEDEARFESVRRLVEYEDYMLLRMKEAGVPSALPFGFVEITPEREFLIVTEFLRDAEEITTAEIDDAVIDDAMLMIRRLWDAGIAHRDVKPANVLLRDGKVRLIDVAFSTMRPSPWRQAVDLANMMIILGLRTSPERVYERALRFFAPDDIAEAFAATKSVTIPSQSKALLRTRRKQESIDVVAAFRQLAPHRDPISTQRWSPRRIGLTVATVLVLLALLSIFADNLIGKGFV
jgi:tRNA A-37 threonylcarbamoyl transferase component Bud32